MTQDDDTEPEPEPGPGPNKFSLAAVVQTIISSTIRVSCLFAYIQRIPPSRLSRFDIWACLLRNYVLPDIPLHV